MKPADVIDSRYRLERLIGTGGMAEVWLAEDQRLGRWVAVKVLRDVLPGEQAGELVSSFEREARLIARMQHPNIVQVYDTGTFAGRHYIVMEYVHGYSLRALLDARQRLSEGEAVRYATQIAAALQYAHDQNVIHCDVKPENVLISEQGVPKLADFGVAETLSRTLSPQEVRDILGTIAYLAPEVIQGAPADPRSDVYSLALTLYEMLAGRLPWAGSSPAAVAGQRLAIPAPPVRSFDRNISAEVESVLARALALGRGDRYQSAGEFGNALRRIPADRPARQANPGEVTGPGAAAIAAYERTPRPEGFPVRRHTQRVPRGTVSLPPPGRDGGTNGAVLATIIAAVLFALGAGVAAALILIRDDSSKGGSATPTTAPPPTRVQPTPTRAQPTPTPTNEPTITPTPTISPTATPGPSTPAPTPTKRPPSPSPGPSQTGTVPVSPTHGTPLPTQPNGGAYRGPLPGNSNPILEGIPGREG